MYSLHPKSLSYTGPKILLHIFLQILLAFLPMTGSLSMLPSHSLGLVRLESCVVYIYLYSLLFVIL